MTPPAMPDMTAEEVIETLGLNRHPEGGWFRETWRAETEAETDRATGSAIYYLIARGEHSHWHCVDATEIWHYHMGAPLDLRIAPPSTGPAKLHRLGPDLAAGMRPQIIVPAHHWQTADTRGDYTLVSCTVSPAFTFSGFKLGHPDFNIPD